jgi:hypothetical protein
MPAKLAITFKLVVPFTSRLNGTISETPIKNFAREYCGAIFKYLRAAMLGNDRHS